MNNPPLTTSPVASAKANDTLESTLLKINDNMLTVSKSMSSVQETFARFADGQRPAKRQRVDEISDSDIDIDTNNDASDSNSDTLLKSDFLRMSRIGRHSRKIDFSFISPKHTFG